MIPFYRPLLDWSEIKAALQPGLGRDDFESALAARVGAKYGVAFAYGRSAIIATLQALNISQADIVIPAYTCLAVAEAIIESGNQPRFVDIDLTNFNMDIKALPAAITPQTQAIIAIHLYGYPTDVNAIRETIDNKDIIIIEDCASGLLTFSPGASEIRGDVGIFSFGPAKHLYTIQGGIAVTNLPHLYEKIKNYRDREMNHLAAVVLTKRWVRFIAGYFMFNEPIYGLLHKAQLVGSGKHTQIEVNFSPEEIPRDYATAFANFQGRVGLAQLNKLEGLLSKRRVLADLYSNQLDDIPDIIPAPIIEGATYSYYTLRIKHRDKLDFRHNMLAQGVAIDQAYDYTLPLLKPYRSYAKGQYPRAEQASREVVNLPNYPALTKTKVQFVVECVQHALEKKPTHKLYAQKSL